MAKILVVDDQENIVRLLELALGGEHQVMTAYNGEQAMDAVGRDRPDVIVLDIIMPVLDGYRVLHRIKSNPETQDITIIMLTQKDQPDDIVLGFTVGADYYVPKPFNVADVASLIRRHLAAQEGEA
jgi:two-component system sensor histidine kinase ChiS